MREANEGTCQPAPWPWSALFAAIARAHEVGDDHAQAQRSADEIRRALVQVQRQCRDAERAARAALDTLARGERSGDVEACGHRA